MTDPHADLRTENCRTCDLTYPAGTEHRCTDGWTATTPDPHADLRALLSDALKAVELRPYGTVGPDKVPWVSHGGVSHGEDRPDCLTCQLEQRLRAAPALLDTLDAQAAELERLRQEYADYRDDHNGWCRRPSVGLDAAAGSAELERLRRVEAEARTVMAYLREHGAGIVPHLVDTDDNPGERLRQALGPDYGDSTATQHRSDTRGPCLACRHRDSALEDDHAG